MINNAGIVGDAPFEDMTADRLEPLVDVHLKGAFYVTRPAWNVMRERGTAGYSTPARPPDSLVPNA